MGIATVAVFHQDDPFGQDGLAAAKRALADTSIKLVATAGYKKNTTEVAEAVKTIDAANPMGVIMVSNTAASAAFVKAFRPDNPATQLIALSVTDGSQVADRIGARLARGLGVVQVVPDPVAGTEAIAAEVRKAWEAHPQQGVELSHTVLEGYLMAKVLVAAIDKAGPAPTRRALVAALNGMRNFDAGGLSISYSPEDHAGPSFTDITVLDRNGRPIR